MPDESTAAATAVAEKPETTPASTDAAKPESGSPPSPPDSGASDNEAKTPSLVDEAVSAAVSKQLADLASEFGVDGEFKTAAELREAIAEAQKSARSDESEATIEDHYNNTLLDIADGLKGDKFKVTDDDGSTSEGALTNAQINELVAGPLHALRDAVRQAEAQETYTELGLVASQMLPKDQHEAFDKAVNKDGKGMGIKDWTNTLIEHMAPHSKAWKAREAEHKAELAAEKAKAWEEGNKAPPGQPSQRGEGSQGVGKLTAAQFMAMSPMERVAWSKANPEEFKKLGT